MVLQPWGIHGHDIGNDSENHYDEGDLMDQYLRMGLIIWFLLGIVSNDVWGAVLYTVTDLGTLGGTESRAYGINESGQVVVFALTWPSDGPNAFRSEDPNMLATAVNGGRSVG
ncbi:MAG: hypothetical protein JXM70_15190 [Pirellulales bacterium]|nr:hypothetical protein [Pirellulales bacterium]